MDKKKDDNLKIKLPVPKEENVEFTLRIPKSLNKKVVAEAKKYKLTKIGYIRFMLEQVVEGGEKE